MVSSSNSNRYYVYPWKVGSQSARALAEALGGRVLKTEGSSFIPSNRKKVINWGSSSCPWSCINTPTHVGIMGNKLLSFNQFEINSDPPRYPRVTTVRADALAWTKCSGIVARTVLNGHSGAGIVIKDRDHKSEIPQAPLYVEYIPKDAEYRVHVFKSQTGDLNVIDVQRKVRDPDREPTNWKVRSHANGFIYTRRNQSGESYTTVAPSDVLIQARKALACSGLTFGAVDMIWSEKRGQAFVLEINSACGMEGETVVKYRDAVRSYFNV